MSQASTGLSDSEFGKALSPAQACARLNCSMPTLYGLVAAGELESFKLGRFRKILNRSIDKLIARRLEAERAQLAARSD
jgi:excisionase family DNA binding protein